jgi:hypothetical protein
MTILLVGLENAHQSIDVFWLEVSDLHRCLC